MEMRQETEFDFLEGVSDEYSDDQELKSETRSRKSLIVFLFALLLSGIAIKSTLAANINLNSGGVQFGQGVTQTIACAETVTVTPVATFKNPLTSNKSNSIIYAWTGDGLVNGGIGFNGLGYSLMEGVAGVANYVTVRVAPQSGNQVSGVADPGNTASTYGSVVTVSGAGATISQADNGIVNVAATQIVYSGGHSLSNIRILTPSAGTVTLNLYKEISTGVFSSSVSETVVITVKVSASGNFPATEPWQFSSVKVSGLNSRCYGMEFSIRAYGSGSSSALDAYVYTFNDPSPADIGRAARIIFESSTASISSGYSGYSVTRLSNTSFKIDFTTPSAASNDVYKVTLESGEPQ